MLRRTTDLSKVPAYQPVVVIFWSPNARYFLEVLPTSSIGYLRRPATYVARLHRRPLTSSPAYIVDRLHRCPLISSTAYIVDRLHRRPLTSSTAYIVDRLHRRPLTSLIRPLTSPAACTLVSRPTSSISTRNFNPSATSPSSLSRKPPQEPRCAHSSRKFRASSASS